MNKEKKKGKEKNRNYTLLPMQISAVSILNFTHSRYSFVCFKTMNATLIHCEKKIVCMYYAFEIFYDFEIFFEILCTSPGVGVSVHIYVKVFSMAYIF